MADAQAAKKVHDTIQKNVKPLADEAFKRVLKAVPALNAAMKDLAASIKGNQSSDVVTTDVRALTIAIRDVNDARGRATDALDKLADATKDDDDFAADEKEIKDLQAKLARTRDSLADLLVKAKKATDDAKAAIDRNDKGETAAHRRWDTLITQFEGQIANLKKINVALVKTQAAAIDAVKQRDATKLKAAKDEIDYYLIDNDALDSKLLLNRTKELLSSFDLDSFSKEFIAEIAQDKVSTIGAYDKAAQAGEKQLKAIQDAVDKLEIAPPDYVKVTAKLGFKANFNARVSARRATSGTWCRRRATRRRRSGSTVRDRSPRPPDAQARPRSHRIERARSAP